MAGNHRNDKSPKQNKRPKKKPGNRRTKAGPSRRKGSSKRQAPTTRHYSEPLDTEEADVRFVQPFQATKSYLCPGCNRDIPIGLGHMVVVPRLEPDLRRHWHRGCWNNRTNLR